MSDWVPVARTLTDILSPWPVQAMRALLDREPEAQTGDALPLGWHWLYFREPVRASQMAADGHAVRGGFLPPVDLPRRMWAGGTFTFHRAPRLGEVAELRSVVTRVEEKRGRSGPLVFVTVQHEVHQHGLCVAEDQTVVYRGSDGPPAGAEADTSEPSSPPDWEERFVPTEVALFQFSALTYNAHRIHYDRPYATKEEGYPGLLVHGPLTALLLLDAAGRHGPAVRQFRYRALSPLLAGEPIWLTGREGEEGRVVEARGPGGRVAMRAHLD